MCRVVKDKLIKLDNIVDLSNFNMMLDDYMLLLMEYQVINYYLRSINKISLDSNTLNPITDSFINTISKLENFIKNPYVDKFNIKEVYSGIWTLISIEAYVEAIDYATIVVNFYDKLEELLSVSVDDVIMYGISDRLQKENSPTEISYYVYKNKQSARIMLAECYVGIGNFEKASKLYYDIITTLNEDSNVGIPKIPHWTAKNRILESAIKLSKISDTIDVTDVLDIFINIRANSEVGNITEGTYESLLTTYMIKKEYF
jgi:hypothetical protein